MPRPPNPKSKTIQLILKCVNEHEAVRVRACKEICARNGIKIKDVLMQGVDSFLRKHNWPPGNSQTQMTTFVERQLVEKRKCDYPGCAEQAVYIDYPHPPGEAKVYSCQFHHDKALENQLLKASKRL